MMLKRFTPIFSRATNRLYASPLSWPRAGSFAAPVSVAKFHAKYTFDDQSNDGGATAENDLLYADMNADERKLVVMTKAVAMGLDADDHETSGGRALIEQRQTFEEILKLSARSLSHKTDSETLVKLLRICAFIEHDKITGKLLEYLKPKLGQLDNQELS